MSSSSAQDELVDDRVEGAIEGLNEAIDQVNLLEDRKVLISAAAGRTVSVVSVQMDVLDKQYKPISDTLAPLLNAREAARAALVTAQEAEERYALALGEVELAREALHLMRSAAANADPEGMREVERHLRDKQTTSVKRAAGLRRSARRARAAANTAVRNVGVAGLRLERTTKPLEEALHLDKEYQQQRKEFQTVIGDWDERIEDIESKKAAAVDLVHSAMWQLETLSNELHEGDSSSQRSGDGDDQAGGDNSADAAARNDDDEESAGSIGDGSGGGGSGGVGGGDGGDCNHRTSRDGCGSESDAEGDGDGKHGWPREKDTLDDATVERALLIRPEITTV